MKLQEVVNDRSFDYGYLYKRMWKFIKPFWVRGILGILLAIPVGLADGVMTFSLKPYFDIVINGKNPALAKTFALWLPFVIIAFTAVLGALKYLNNYLNEWTGQKITIELKKALFEKLLTFETAFYDKNSSGLVMMRFLTDADGACSGIISNLKGVLTSACSALSLLFVLIYMSWKLAIVSVIISSCSFLPARFIKSLIKRASFEGMKIGSNVSTYFFETVNGNKIISSFNLQNYQYKKIKDQLNQAFNLSMQVTKRMGWISPILALISACGLAGVMWYGNYLLASKELTAGSLMAFIASAIALYKPVKSIGESWPNMQGSFVTMNRIIDLFDLKPNIKNAEKPVKIDTIKDSIKLENLWFEYEEGRPVLNGISLEVKIGTSLAIVGNSGGGKTTIANLIPRFYDISQGSIKIDGIDVREIDLSDLRQNISVVFQDNFLFSGTLKENILMGKFDATEEEINQAVKNAYLDEFIASLPESLNTEIGERGVKLSGGQKQRLAIARAMIKNAPVVILDEATSALDNKSEAIVQKALDKLMENKTVIVIAHRLSTIQNADKIAVIDSGAVIELGNHNELLNIENGAYKSLYLSQFRKQEERENQCLK